ncbi:MULTISPECIES: glycosyltransferase [Rothia]|uniref:Glycosyl transferase n=1 Tax=Rothia nasimurium TaxID=85336 RepID=A0A1Y1RPM0_9MICC|nr:MULTISPECIES: glycosyltransferase [Rothia]ORC18852.1 glycosyl transferase [Rothia nasimurium]
MTEKNTPTVKTLQRIILPEAVQTDVIPLYIDSGSASGVQLPTRLDGDAAQTIAQATAQQELKNESTVALVGAGPDVLGRRSAHIASGKTVSFGTYFNAFPASYWRRWTNLKSVTLQLTTDGEGMVVVYKSNARGVIQRVDARVLDGTETTTFDLTLDPFGDGGWYWFDLTATKSDLTLIEAEWLGANTPRLGEAGGRATVQITTMNKVQYCIDNIRSLGNNLDALETVKEILIVDQGTDKVQDHPDFEEVVAPLAGKFRIINQANLGGSGGFARGMFEAVNNGSDYVLLLDDDVVVEPESILRLITFADYCKNPTIVGGHMFDMYDRSVLHAFGEVVNPWRTFYDKPYDDMSLGHDLGKSNLRSTHWMHRRVDVDYNGWWMCLIPTEVINRIGLSLPLFLKWDDAEYGLRAKEAGVATVSFPGAGLWHVSWQDKDDSVGWQAYFHERNRLITALIHSPFNKGGSVLRESLFLDVKHALSMQYYTEEGRLMAVEDLLSGPEHLHPSLSERLPVIRGKIKEFQDAQLKPDVDEYPQPKTHKPPFKGRRNFKSPGYQKLIPWAVSTLGRQLFKPVDELAKTHPQVQLNYSENRWWTVSKFDSLLVTNAEGTGVFWYQRDPKKLRENLARATKLHAKLFADWSALRDQYRTAAAEVASYDAWAKTFEKHTESELIR